MYSILNNIDITAESPQRQPSGSVTGATPTDNSTGHSATPPSSLPISTPSSAVFSASSPGAVSNTSTSASDTSSVFREFSTSLSGEDGVFVENTRRPKFREIPRMNQVRIIVMISLPVYWLIHHNSLAPARFERNFQYVILKLTFSNWYMRYLMKLPSDECHWTLLILSQHFFM